MGGPRRARRRRPIPPTGTTSYDRSRGAVSVRADTSLTPLYSALIILAVPHVLLVAGLDWSQAFEAAAVQPDSAALLHFPGSQ